VDKVEAEVPTDLLAGLLMERASAPAPTQREPENLQAKIYAVIALTSLLTFGTLVTGYQLLFSHHLFA
jgi:hypothetical protein